MGAVVERYAYLDDCSWGQLDKYHAGGGGVVGVTHLFASKTMGGCSGPMKGYGKGSRWSHPTLTPAQSMPSSLYAC